ncbi:hypothetical protein JL37_25720 [Achromobacter sp. RTa]|uniref:hypothetical protein n=1 Tax=Achromobacter sp. RTa TaxID=1532557 RepID=UPI00051063B8|nr:hypothetical protein [Achromobacter sp. RTa]KGD87983.1 hypothetical protein JL37_25720 [Achromobacter sp. RTa]
MPRPPAPFAPPTRQASSRQNSLAWVLEPLARDPNYAHRRMFGSDAAYLDGLLYLIASDREDPWNGVLVCTSKERHAALLADVPNLLQHPVLGKWLYLPQEDEDFESTAARLAELALARDPRLGVAPRPKARRRKGWREED